METTTSDRTANSARPATGAFRAIVLGAGYRGRAYADFAREHPDRLGIVGVADPVRADDIPAPRRWRDWRDCLAERPDADIAIIALPDLMHRDAAVAAIEAGYHLLLEKPLATTEDECREIVSLAIRRGRLVMLGHILRYTAYFAHIKALVDSGELGEIVSISHQESAAYWKVAHSFVRGNWANASRSSPIILQKCSHDFDLFCWWIGRRCLKVSSFGSIKLFRRDRMPAGAAERCVACPPEIERRCIWSARNIYLEHDTLAYLFPGATREDLERMIAESDYGRCVFQSDNDVPDHQSVMLEFEGGATVSHVMTGFTERNVRTTRISLTRGEIVGDGENIDVHRFDGHAIETGAPARFRVPNRSRHGGGDFNLVAEMLAKLRRGDQDEWRRTTEESLESHLVCFAAERSRLAGGKLVEIHR